MRPRLCALTVLGSTREKPKKCPTCPYTTGDPGSLTNHRKTLHAYKPRAKRDADATALLPPTDAAPVSTCSSSSTPPSEHSTRSWNGLPPPPSFQAFSGYSPHYLDQAFRPHFPPSPSFSSTSPSTASWSSNMLIDPASGRMAFRLADAARMCMSPAGSALPFVAPHHTPRPGPTGLYPADSHFYLGNPPAPTQLSPPWAISEEALAAIIAQTAGLDPISLSPSFAPFAYNAPPYSSHTTSHSVQHGFAPEFSFELEDPVAYHLHGALSAWAEGPQY
ncbi:hypothetical protein B0H14DRAFT_2559777 [Mycena olivaceomarginata]|nr:hypothetical protein B0H14DRAFT_2559777 [Mycena olivaceomarginata]